MTTKILNLNPKPWVLTACHAFVREQPKQSQKAPPLVGPELGMRAVILGLPASTIK